MSCHAAERVQAGAPIVEAVATAGTFTCFSPVRPAFGLRVTATRTRPVHLLDIADGVQALPLQRGQMLVEIVPDLDGPGRRERLTTALRGAAAIVGVTVPVDRLPPSVGLAQLAAELGEARMLSDDPLFVDEHLAALRHRHLAPLAALSGSTRDRLSATLRSWLMNMGNRTAMPTSCRGTRRRCDTGWAGCVSCSGPR